MLHSSCVFATLYRLRQFALSVPHTLTREAKFLVLPLSLSLSLLFLGLPSLASSPPPPRQSPLPSPLTLTPALFSWQRVLVNLPLFHSFCSSVLVVPVPFAPPPSPSPEPRSSPHHQQHHRRHHERLSLGKQATPTHALGRRTTRCTNDYTQHAGTNIHTLRTIVHVPFLSLSTHTQRVSFCRWSGFCSGQVW